MTHLCYAFQLNPALINTVREDVRSECSNYGDVKKITVYDVSIILFFIRYAPAASACWGHRVFEFSVHLYVRTSVRT